MAQLDCSCQMSLRGAVIIECQRGHRREVVCRRMVALKLKDPLITTQQVLGVIEIEVCLAHVEMRQHQPVVEVRRFLGGLQASLKIPMQQPNAAEN